MVICSGCEQEFDDEVIDGEEFTCSRCASAKARSNQSLPSCRGKQRGGRRMNAGRPSLGVTKKVSITLPVDAWAWFDDAATGNRSELLRQMIRQQEVPQGEWSNNAALGYAIFGAQKMGFSEEQTKELVRAIRSEFDCKSVDQAKAEYNNSPY